MIQSEVCPSHFEKSIFSSFWQQDYGRSFLFRVSLSWVSPNLMSRRFFICSTNSSCLIWNASTSRRTSILVSLSSRCSERERLAPSWVFAIIAVSLLTVGTPVFSETCCVAYACHCFYQWWVKCALFSTLFVLTPHTPYHIYNINISSMGACSDAVLHILIASPKFCGFSSFHLPSLVLILAFHITSQWAHRSINMWVGGKCMNSTAPWRSPYHLILPLFFSRIRCHLSQLRPFLQGI